MKDSLEHLKELKVFCILPWIHINVWTDGKVFPCCIADSDLPVGHLGGSPLEEIWNSPDLRQIRLNMLNNRPSPQCSKCYELENSGFKSHRQKFNQNFSQHFVKALNTSIKGTTNIHMPYMDIRFSNICNFRCRTCCPELSSGWYEDWRALGNSYPKKIIQPTPDPKDLWKQIEPLLPYVEEIYFAGGEPLIMEEHYQILKFLIEKKMFHVCLSYNTNFSTINYRDQDVMKIWDQFEMVHVGASLDAMGKRGEYLRKGQKWDQVLSNRKRMFEICPRVHFYIALTLSVMNLFHVPDFHKEWLEKGYIKNYGININMLLYPEEYRIQILPDHLKERAIKKYEDHIERYIRPSENGSREVEERFKEALNFLKAKDLSHLIPKFKETTQKLDKIRGENFVEIFPELQELMKATI